MRSAMRTTEAALFAVAATCMAGVAEAQVRAKAELRCEQASEVLLYECTVALADRRTNEPLAGLAVTVGADMPSMAGAHSVRPVVASEGPVKGTYRFRLELEMHGDWALQINLSGATRDRVVKLLRFEDGRVGEAPPSRR
jgi:hypothetical protein